ncbi:Molecular chaperone (Small heat shock protein) [Nitrosotalea sinensis]|uniref:Molecular chaperone (Small heat shock protein) n=2 Tax=Nitrosotalea sinensis TaxID=1499975 RepID=A0A2H1EFS7_9ARCH|nr:Molecular chaperone (Small heat shock protein) [Candidatus Nitrosotalea sinensis]
MSYVLHSMHNYDMNEWDEFDQLFQKMMRPFKGLDKIWNDMKMSDDLQTFGPYYYGYSLTVGPDGKPVVKEYGNVKPGLSQKSEVREPFVDVIVDEKEKVLKIVAEMPGVEKKDIKIEVVGRTVNLDAENGDKKYHTKIPIKQKVDEDSVKATYSNGILEVKFQLKEDRPQGRTVTVE